MSDESWQVLLEVWSWPKSYGPFLLPIWPVLTDTSGGLSDLYSVWHYRQLRKLKMQEAGTFVQAFPAQSHLQEASWAVVLSWNWATYPVLNLIDNTHHSLGSTGVANENVARWENFPTGKSLGDSQFHCKYSVLSRSKNTQFCLAVLVYKRVWEIEVNPSACSPERGYKAEEAMKERTFAKVGKQLILS